MTATTTSGTTQGLVHVTYVQPVQLTWGAYGVLAEDGGISYKTYPSADEAKRDALYRGRAKIIRLGIVNEGVEEERQPSSAELLMQELRKIEPEAEA